MSVDCIWGWISSNLDALIVELIGFIGTSGLIALILWCRDRARWAPMRRQVGGEIADALGSGLWGIVEFSGVSWPDIIAPEGLIEQVAYSSKEYHTILARFVEQQYEADFKIKYRPILVVRNGDEWLGFARSLDSVVTDLDRGVRLAANLFGPEVTTPLLEVREAIRVTQRIIADESYPPWVTRHFDFIQSLASKMARTLLLLWKHVD